MRKIKKSCAMPGWMAMSLFERNRLPSRCLPGFFPRHGGDIQCVQLRRHPVGHGVIDQPMPADTLQCIEPGVDYLDPKMPGTTRRASVADMQMALVLNLNRGVGKCVAQALK